MIKTKFKLSGRLSVVFLLCSCTVTMSWSQTAYKGQLFIGEESFTRQGDLLRVRMKVSYDRTAVGPGESLTFTPVIKSDSTACYLSSVVIDGDRREKADRRADVLSRRRRTNLPVVVRSGRSGELYFNYDTTVPYERWMDRGSLYTESEECNCNGRRGRLFEDRILSSLPFFNTPRSTADPLSRPAWLLGCVEFLKPSGTSGPLFTKRGTVPLYGDRALWRLSTKKFNKAVSDLITSDIRTALSTESAGLESISLKGYGAPSGNYRKNEATGMKRALSLKKYLMHNRLANKNALEVSWRAEDWDSVSSLVSRSNMPLKDAVLNIIRAVDVVAGREKELMSLDGGLPYRYLETNVFPMVCRISYSLTFRRHGMDTRTGILTLKNNPSSMSLGDLYAVAENYERGSREFNDIIDLSARLFPGNAEANINAAGVALLRNDTAQAGRYLSGWLTDPRAYNNIGLLYLLEGNTDKAEVYLEMAKAAGVKQAEEALRHLH
jgi:hypothetical protein